jgi:ribosomal protein L22
MPKNYSKYQQKVIKNYYDNREQIDAQRLSELVTNLFLAKGKKRKKFWNTAEEVMQRLKVPPSRIEHVLQSDDPVTLVEVVNDLQAGKLP